MDVAFSQKSRRTKEQPISFLMAAAVQNPELISLAAGLVDQDSLPAAPMKATLDELFADDKAAKIALQYGTTHGLLPLRQACLEHVCQLDGVSAKHLSLTPEYVVITTGSQQSLYVIAEVLVDPGDIVIAADPSYFVYTGTLASFGATVLTVPMDEHGMKVDKLEQLLIRLRNEGRLEKLKFIYCTSYFQNPTGLTLSAERRPKMLELVRRFSTPQHRLLILEDAAYRELHYDGPAPRTIKSHEADNRHVIGTFTFSKPLAPGLKTGYAILPTDLVDPFLQQKGNHDFGSPNLCQHLANRMLRDGSYARHVELLRQTYRPKRDAMLAALKRHMPKLDGLSWVHPAGGLYVWVTLPEGMDVTRTSSFFTDCIERGVLYVPGAYAHQPREDGSLPTNTMRLSFGHVPIDKIDQGVARLAEAVKATATR